MTHTLPRLLVGLPLVLAVAVSASGQTATWTGAGNTPNWTNVANWTNTPQVVTTGRFPGDGAGPFTVLADHLYPSTAANLPTTTVGSQGVAGAFVTFDRGGLTAANLTLSILTNTGGADGNTGSSQFTLTNGTFAVIAFQAETTNYTGTYVLSPTATVLSYSGTNHGRVTTAGTLVAGGNLSVGATSNNISQRTELDVTGGQTAVGGSLTVGSGSVGTAYTSVSGGLLSVAGATTVNANSGGGGSTSRLLVSGGTFRTGSLTTNGRLTHTGGRLEVAGGTFTPTAAAAPYVVNGGSLTDQPTVAVSGAMAAVNNVTTLTVGDTRQGAFEVLAGGNLVFDAVSVGASATGGGSVLVAGAGSRLAAPGGFGVGGSPTAAGGTGSLTVGTGGTAATTGTLALWAGGTLNLTGGRVEANTFAANGGAVNFAAGEFRFTAPATLDASTASALLGAAREVSAGRTVSGTDLALGTSVGVTGGTLSAGTLTNDGTLRVSAGRVQTTGAVANPAGRTITVSGTGELAPAGGLSNAGTLLLDGNQVAVGGGTLANSGTVRGSGLVAAPLANAVSGQVQVTSGQRLQFDGATNTSAGVVSVIGGEAQFAGPITNAASTGLVTGRDAILRFDGGLANNGSLAVSTGTTDVFGNVANTSTGRISVSGGGTATFYGDLTHANTTNPIQVSAGSRAVFFGGVSGPGSFSGTGTVFLEGDLRPGASPGLVGFGGDVVLGQGSRYVMEIGGTARGTGYDSLAVAGELALGGTLEVQLIDGFAPAAGDRFTVASFGRAADDFDRYVGLSAAGGTFQPGFEAGRLVLTFTPVPEPALLLVVAAGGLAVSWFGGPGLSRGRGSPAGGRTAGTRTPGRTARAG